MMQASLLHPTRNIPDLGFMGFPRSSRLARSVSRILSPSWRELLPPLGLVTLYWLKGSFALPVVGAKRQTAPSRALHTYIITTLHPTTTGGWAR